jgi:voltage-gated potassium channel
MAGRCSADMSFEHKLAAAAVLVVLTLMLQCAWIAVLILWGRAHFEHERRAFGVFRAAWMMVWIMADMVLLHVLQIMLWGGFYRWRCLPSWASAVYLSAASYTTVGAGDASFPPACRAFGPLESLTGVLMCGLSAGFLFAIVTRLVRHDERLLEQGELPPLAPHRASPPAPATVRS